MMTEFQDKRIIVLAVDGSEEADLMVDCKYLNSMLINWSKTASDNIEYFKSRHALYICVLFNMFQLIIASRQSYKAQCKCYMNWGIQNWNTDNVTWYQISIRIFDDTDSTFSSHIYITNHETNVIWIYSMFLSHTAEVI